MFASNQLSAPRRSRLAFYVVRLYAAPTKYCSKRESNGSPLDRRSPRPAMSTQPQMLPDTEGRRWGTKLHALLDLL